MQSKALTNINGHKLNFKCVNFAKEKSKDKEKNLSILKISISTAYF